MLVLQLMHRFRPTLVFALAAAGCDTSVPPTHEPPAAPQPYAPVPQQSSQPSAPASARAPTTPRHARTQLEPLREAPAAEPQLPPDPLARAAAERNAKKHGAASETTPPPAEPVAPAPPPSAPPPPLPPAPDQTSLLAPPPEPRAAKPSDQSSHELSLVAPDALCVTRGTLAKTHVDVPTFRAVATGHAGDAASVRVRVHGTSKNERALASGQHRRQVGLKLRAANGCNVVYVMWRLDPKPKLEVSVKANPGERTAQECGANGYTKVTAARTAKLPALLDDQEHELRAAIEGDMLLATVDGSIVWQGTLPAAAAQLVGPAGVRSDNLDLDIVSFSADSRTQSVAKLDCKGGGDEESD